MKLMEAVKQLKFWSRKKKRKKGLQYHKLDYHDYDHYYHIQPTYDPPPPPPPSRLPPPLQPVGVYKVTRPLDNARQWKQSYDDPPPPSSPPELPPIQCQYQFCEPSAPPLPPWVNLESTFEKYSYSTHHYNPIDPISNTDQPSSSSQSNSNHQDSSPIMEDGEHAIITAMNGRVDSRNVFRCVVDVGALFLRWFGPCFGVAEHRRKKNYSGGSVNALPNLDVFKKTV